MAEIADMDMSPSFSDASAAGKESGNSSPKPSEKKSPELITEEGLVNDDSGCVTPRPTQQIPRTLQTPYRLFNREKSIHEVLGGGKAADVILWRKRSICIGMLVAGSTIWFLFEQSGYTFLSVVASLLLILVSVLFIWGNAASILHRPPPPLPDLTLSEEVVAMIASSICKKLNSILGVAYDISSARDVKLFFKVAFTLFITAILGRYLNFLTLAYICLVLCLSLPVLYNKYEDEVDKNAEKAHQQILKHYKSLDEKVLRKIPRSIDRNVLSKIPRQFSARKDKSN